MVPHLVAEELRGRGVECVHILSWDDYDRLRRVPAGAPPELAAHIGRPLSLIADPRGDYDNLSERYKSPFRQALAALGVEVREISQTEMYNGGAYTAQVLRALQARSHIDRVLSEYRTLAAGDGDGHALHGEYHPYQVYCEACGRDTTTITAYDPDTTVVAYACRDCGLRGALNLSRSNSGKLVWKVDWPMRWAYEGVLFEAAGADHSSPGSSFTVGSRLVRDIFGGKPPVYASYAFVGTRGATKMSSSAGGAPTPQDALRILEAPIVRWLYARRRPNQSITIDLGAEVVRLYDEWDSLLDRVAAGRADPLEGVTVRRATETSLMRLPAPARALPFRMLASVADVTVGDDRQILRILRQSGAGDGSLTLRDVEPRLARATAWVAESMPPEQRTRVRAEPNVELLRDLDEDDRKALSLLLERLDEDWSLDGLTRLVYGIPKLIRGLPETAPPTPELKHAQRAFFVLLYRLLVDSDTGPRLPTLLLAVGQDSLHELLRPDAVRAPGA